MLATLIQQVVNGLMIGSIYALVALGLTMIFGLLGILNFAQGQLLMLAAFAVYLLSGLGLGFGVSLALAVLIVASIAVVLESVVFRPVEGLEISGLIVSLGLIGIIENVALAVFGTDFRSLPVSFPGAFVVAGVVLIKQRLFIFTVCLLIVAALFGFLRLGKWGLAMRATLQNRDAAALVGIPSRRIVTLTFGISGALAAVAGGLMGTVFPVEPLMGNDVLLKGFIAVILGGAGSPVGAVLGAAILGVTEAVGGGYTSGTYQDVFGLAMLILVLLVRPRGLLPDRQVERAG
jgi:branched-chain amino acid transport system permease protein